MTNLSLDLSDGFCLGPLFAPPNKIRPLARPPGKQGAVHRAQTKRATPKWVDQKKVAEFYKEAKRLTRLTGELHVVDHIVPKISDSVCGLHVEYNLRVIHWLENAKKGSFWWPDMWMEQQSLL